MAAEWEPQFVTIDRDLALRFFLDFARFEFALKNSRFFRPRETKPSEPQDAQPDWEAFASSIRETFLPESRPELSAACDYLIRLSPPGSEVVSGKAVVWDTTPPPADLPVSQRVLLAVRRVRNNLFHGAKFSHVPAGDAGRNTALLEYSLVVLGECLRLSAEVRQVYADASL